MWLEEKDAELGKLLITSEETLRSMQLTKPFKLTQSTHKPDMLQHVYTLWLKVLPASLA